MNVTSSNVTANEEGVVDGFTPQRTRGMFVCHGPKARKSLARSNQGQFDSVPPVVSPPVQVTQTVTTIEDDDAADRKKEVNGYFDR